MPQTFQVLRCFQCLVFQVHPTKKSNKWKCKMCGEKQSIKRFYGLGTGKECRLHVQKLNGIQGESHNSKFDDSDESTNSSDNIEQDETVSDSKELGKTVPIGIVKKSKWADYLDKVEENDQQFPDKTMHLNETEVVLELPKKLPRKTQRVINKTGPFSSENRCLPSTYNMSNKSTNGKTLESKQCNRAITNSCHTKLPSQPNPPAKTEIHKKEVLLSTVSNSKWAQYSEETENSNDEDSAIINQTDLQDSKNFFSLLDEDNLDAVLDF